MQQEARERIATLQAARAEARQARSAASDVEDNDDVVVEYRH